MAQPGSALAWGARGRRFESFHTDHLVYRASAQKCPEAFSCRVTLSSGLRYSTLVTKPDQHKTYHEQVGYWLWEPATGRIIHTLTLARGGVLMASGRASADARSFGLRVSHVDSSFGTRSTPYVQHGFRTDALRIRVTLQEDDSWRYEADTVLKIRGQSEPFHHSDRNHLRRLAPPTPNPLARN